MAQQYQQNLQQRLERNATPNPILYSIRVRFTDPMVVNITNARNFLFGFGQPVIENEEPSIEILQIRTRLREGVEHFLQECGRRVRRRKAYFDGSNSIFRPDPTIAEEDNLEASLFLDIPGEEQGHFVKLQNDIMEIANSINWNMQNAIPQENNLVIRIQDAPKVRMCDFNDNNIGQLTFNIQRAPNLPFNGSFAGITAVPLGEENNFEIPVINFDPRYNPQGGPHVNFRPGHGNPNHWP